MGNGGNIAAMTGQEIRSRLKAHKEELEAMGIASLALFGSMARGDAVSTSDVDFLIQFREEVGLFHFFKVQHRLEEILGVEKVDLVEHGALHPALKEAVLREAVDVA